MIKWAKGLTRPDLNWLTVPQLEYDQSECPTHEYAISMIVHDKRNHPCNLKWFEMRVTPEISGSGNAFYAWANPGVTICTGIKLQPSLILLTGARVTGFLSSSRSNCLNFAKVESASLDCSNTIFPALPNTSSSTRKSSVDAI